MIFDFFATACCSAGSKPRPGTLIESRAPLPVTAFCLFVPCVFVCCSSGSTGGALLISGGLILHGFSSFIANEAGVGGLAIESFADVGVDFEDFGMMLVNNSFHCPLGQYSFDADVNVSRVGATVTYVRRAYRATRRLPLIRAYRVARYASSGCAGGRAYWFVLLPPLSLVATHVVDKKTDSRLSVCM